MKRFFIAVVIILNCSFTSANAAVMKNTKPLIELTYSKSDQVSSVALTPVSIIISGTTESPSSAWINGALAGSSDGFIASYSSLGTPLWNIRLGNTANEIATQLAIGTITGSAAMLQESGLDAATLRKNVTSPNGTTAAALSVFADKDLEKIISDAMMAAKKRAQELA